MEMRARRSVARLGRLAIDTVANNTTPSFFPRSRPASEPVADGGAEESPLSPTSPSTPNGGSRRASPARPNVGSGSPPVSGRFGRANSSLSVPGSVPGLEHGGKVRVSQIHSRLMRMTMTELSAFAKHLMWLYDEGLVERVDFDALGKTFRRRSAEVLGNTSLGTLDTAAATAEELHELCTRLGGDETPRRSLEARMCYLVMQTNSNEDRVRMLELLVRYHEVVAKLLSKGILSSRTHQTSVNQVSRWIKTATVPELVDHVDLLCSLANSEQQLFEAVSVRIRDIARTGPVAALKDTGLLVHTYKNNGVAALDNEMEELLEKRLRTGGDACTLEELEANIFAEGVQFLCRQSPRLHNAIVSALSRRLERSMSKIGSKVQKAEDLDRLSVELDEWIRVAKCASKANMVHISHESRHQVVGVFSELTTRAMKPNSPLASVNAEIQQLQWKLLVTLNSMAPEDRAAASGSAPEHPRMSLS